MRKFDDSFEAVLDEYARLIDDYENTNAEVFKRLLLDDLIRKASKSLEKTVLEAGFDPTEVKEAIDYKIQNLRLKDGLEYSSEKLARQRERFAFPMINVNRDESLDAGWVALAVHDPAYFGLALEEHGLSEEDRTKICAEFQQQTTPIREQLSKATGAAIDQLKIKLFQIIEHFGIDFEFTSQPFEETITVPLFYLYCPKVENSKLSYGTSQDGKNGLSCSLKIGGMGFSGERGYSIASSSDLYVEPGEAMLGSLEIKVEICTARIKWRDKVIKESTYFATPGQGVVKTSLLTPEERQPIHESFEPCQQGPSIDRTGVSESNIATHGFTHQLHKEVKISGKVNLHSAGIEIGPEIKLGGNRMVKVEYSLPGSHHYNLFADDEFRAAWFEVSG
jgi:hypothetical protein